jgi:hypothetical protein
VKVLRFPADPLAPEQGDLPIGSRGGKTAVNSTARPQVSPGCGDRDSVGAICNPAATPRDRPNDIHLLGRLGGGRSGDCWG